MSSQDEGQWRVPESSIPINDMDGGGGVGGKIGSAFDRGVNIAVGIAAIKAGQRHYEQTGDRGQAIQAGMMSFVWWNVWVVTLFFWFCGWLLNGTSLDHNILYVAIAPFCLGVTWCRNIDYCLFRRGLIYRFYAPIARMVERVPTFVLYLLVFVPLFG